MSTGQSGPRGGTIRIAVDAMGGDYAPDEIIKGALEAARLSSIEIVLVGDQEEVEGELSKYPRRGASSDRTELPIRVVPSEGKIVEDEHPVQALRQKPRASIAVATRLLKQGEADALVSMGSTGAAMGQRRPYPWHSGGAGAALHRRTVPWAGPQNRGG